MRYTINENEAPVLTDSSGSDCHVEWTVSGLQAYSVTGGSYDEPAGEDLVIHALLVGGGDVSVSSETVQKMYRFDGATLVEVTT